MRAFLLMVIGLAAFGAAMLIPHRRVIELEAMEAAIPPELSARAVRGIEPPAETHGYRFTWIEAGECGELLVAGPIEYGGTGVRWFATRDGHEIFEYDPTLFVAGSKGPPTRELRKFLDLPARMHAKTDRLFGWKPLR